MSVPAADHRYTVEPVLRRSGEPRAADTVRQAALMQQSAIPRNAKLSSTTQPSDWMKEVIDFDRNGPGVLGYYLDMVALMGSLCPLYPAVLGRDGQWKRSVDPVLQLALNSWRGHLPQLSQAELAYAAIRSRASIGRCWHIADPELGYVVVANATKEENHLLWITPYGSPRRTPADRVYYSWDQDPYEPWLPTSSIRRALPELRRLRAMVRNQIRMANSRLLTNGLLAFPENDPNGARPLAGQNPNQQAGSSQDSELTGIDRIVDDFIDLAKLAFRDDDSPAANIPFPYIGPAAQWVDLGGNVDQASLEAERVATEAFARAVNFPQQLLTEGPGAANHWNEFLVQESAVKLGLAPKVEPLCADVAAFHLRPTVIRLNNALDGWHYKPHKVRVEADLSFLLKRPKQFAEVIEAYRAGAASRAEVRDALGITDMLDIPHGMSEYEHWELMSHIASAPYAEVSPEGDLIVQPAGAAPPGTPGIPGMAGMPAGGDAAPAPDGAPPAGAAPPAPSSTPSEPTAIDIAEPPMPAQLAALGDTTPNVEALGDPQQLFDGLAEMDRQLQASLTAIATMIVSIANTEIARLTVRALPARSAERARLRDLPPEEVWAAAATDIQANVDPGTVLAEVAERFRPQIEQAIDDSRNTALRRWGQILAAGFIAAAAKEGATAFIRTLVPWFDVRVKAGKPVVKPPVMVARAAMAAAAGAQTTKAKPHPSVGAIAMTASGRPVSSEGGQWHGGFGFLTGDRMSRLLARLYGALFGVKWVHGFYGMPEQPYPAHVDMNNRKYQSAVDIPDEVWPGDHPGCQCEITPTVL